jgi:putative endonuclease
MLLCSDATLYTGITNDLPKRLAAHDAGKGARYTRSRGPVRCVYFESAASKSEALKREYAIKKLSRAEKMVLTSPF